MWCLILRLTTLPMVAARKALLSRDRRERTLEALTADTTPTYSRIGIGAPVAPITAHPATVY